ncbi:MAG: AMP-binding protein, partial [Pseudomonadaceae bacterium]|nr:AMP-binding protein [Pseudomonadaceae bacterium]
MHERDYLQRLRQLQQAAWPAGHAREPQYPLGQRPLTHYLQHWAQTVPDKPAVRFYGHDLSYAELDDLSSRFASLLLDRGVQPGDRVAVYLPNCPQMHIVFYGILKAGAVHCPVSPMAMPMELAYQVKDCGAQVIVSFDQLLPVVRQVADDCQLRLIISTSLSELCPAEPPFPVPDLLLAPKLPVTDSLDLMPALATTAPRELPEPALDDIAALNYTGGTTGLPKGCIHTHGDMLYTCAS